MHTTGRMGHAKLCGRWLYMAAALCEAGSSHTSTAPADEAVMKLLRWLRPE